jgi:hypothetical protein
MTCLANSVLLLWLLFVESGGEQSGSEGIEAAAAGGRWCRRKCRKKEIGCLGCVDVVSDDVCVGQKCAWKSLKHSQSVGQDCFGADDRVNRPVMTKDRLVGKALH